MGGYKKEAKNLCKRRRRRRVRIFGICPRYWRPLQQPPSEKSIGGEEGERRIYTHVVHKEGHW